MFIVSFSLFVAGLIHANHGGKIIEYLLQQLKNATSDVSFTSAWIFQVTYYKYSNSKQSYPHYFNHTDKEIPPSV